MLDKLALFKRFCNTLWEYDASTNQLYMYHNSGLPEWCGEWKPYEECYDLFVNQFVCKEDIDIWEHFMHSDNLKKFLNSDKTEAHFLVRTKHEEQEIECHETYLEKISDTKILIGSKDIKEIQKNATVTQAVFTEIDYVCRINIKTRSYIVYYSGDVRGDVPQSISNDYNKIIREFNRAVVLPDECEQLSDDMMIENVVQQLEDKEEYILYATVLDKGVLLYKKFRFCYADGQKTELLLTRIDISGFVKERKKRELEEKKRIEYLENMPVGFCAMKLILDDNGQPKDFCCTYCNRAYEELYGVKSGALTGQNFYEYFKNADAKWLKYYYETAFLGKEHIIREHSAEIGKDLQIYTFQLEEGHCECVVQDVTKETFLTKELQRSREEMKRILETTTAMVFQYYPKERQILISDFETGEDKMLLSEEETVQKLIEKGFLEPFCEKAVREAFKTMRKGVSNISVTIRARKMVELPWLWYKMVLFDYLDEETQERKILGYLQNVDQDILIQEQLKHMAQTDYLTGILNVGAGKKQVEDCLSRQSRPSENFNVMFLMDIDNFKLVNDTKGHMTGDEVLRSFAQILKTTFRTKDIVYRLGGDEFAVFVEGIQEYQGAVASIMERFKRELIRSKKRYPFLSASVGVFVSNTAKDYEQYYKEADDALYKTKRSGKNHYTVRVQNEGEISEYSSEQMFDADSNL